MHSHPPEPAGPIASAHSHAGDAHPNGPEQEPGHQADRPHAHDSGHRHTRGRAFSALAHWLKPHSHGHRAAALDPALADARGIWALRVSLAALLVTAVFQVIVVALSGSVALLADTLHNFSDALTAVPLWLAFALARRAGNRRYTYGYGRAEDLGGAFIVLMILVSALLVFYESTQKLLNPRPLQHLGWVAAAAIIGFVGNELVALFRLRVGREIGSAALVADGQHARADGFTSLGVLAGAVGVWLGFPLADPLVGLAIGLSLLVIVAHTARDMWRRMMDATEPETVEQIERLAGAVPGVLGVHAITLRWLGHRQRGELHITVDCRLPTVASHQIAEEVRHVLFHGVPALADMTVHVDPCECDESVDYHPAGHHLTHLTSGAD